MINLNENEKLLKAKSYLDKLANGINPITNELASENDTINNIHISRCLFYVSDVLRNLIENNNNTQKKKNSKNGKSGKKTNNKRVRNYSR